MFGIDMTRQGQPYHKLVKTTPKPSATKNSRGELPGVLLFLPESVWVGGAAAADVVLVASAMVDWCVCVCHVSLKSQPRALGGREGDANVLVVVRRAR